MALIRRIGYGGLGTCVPGMVAAVRLLEKEVGILRAYACCRCPLASKALKIFGEEIYLVLPLVENAAVEVEILRAVAVGGIGDAER